MFENVNMNKLNETFYATAVKLDLRQIKQPQKINETKCFQNKVDIGEWMLTESPSKSVTYN